MRKGTTWKTQDSEEMGWEGMGLIDLAVDWEMRRAVVNAVMKLCVP
jgi:hypothetical protein